jgi:hypothetical protein
MGRFWGSGSTLTARSGLAVAIVAASTVLVAPVFADTAGTSTAPHKTKHSSSSTASKTAQPLAPGECGPTPDQASIGMRALQTELMVAGLKCSADQWNSFTAKFKATIKQDADRLQRVFSKTYGKSGASQMNAFVTQLANDASQRSNAFAEADYCKQEDVLFQKVLALTAAELEKFSAKRKVAVVQPVKLCEPDPEPAAGSAVPGAATTPAGTTTAAGAAGGTNAATGTNAAAGTTTAAGATSAAKGASTTPVVASSSASRANTH